MAVITIVVEIPDDLWAGELSGEMWGETWESNPEDVLSDAVDYMRGWRIDERIAYSGSLDAG